MPYSAFSTYSCITYYEFLQVVKIIGGGGGGGGGQNDMFAPPPIFSWGGGGRLPPPPPRIDASVSQHLPY